MTGKHMKYIFAFCLIALLLTMGCTTANKYYTIKISDKFISNNKEMFIVSENTDVLKIGRYCYCDRYVPCYNTFTINNSYIVRLGIEQTPLGKSDIVIEEIIVERDY